VHAAPSTTATDAVLIDPPYVSENGLGPRDPAIDYCSLAMS
jgi:hypothetical protein